MCFTTKATKCINIILKHVPRVSARVIKGGNQYKITHGMQGCEENQNADSREKKARNKEGAEKIVKLLSLQSLHEEDYSRKGKALRGREAAVDVQSCREVAESRVEWASWGKWTEAHRSLRRCTKWWQRKKQSRLR